ncbi:DUF1858 domain-containing protein [Patescibacteria group bacterium]
MKRKKVTKDTKLDEILKLYPKSAEIMQEYGLQCVGCFARTFDTIEDAAKIHGMKDKDVKEMIEKIHKSE